MIDIDFKEFEINIDHILPNLSNSEKSNIKNRIIFEIEKTLKYPEQQRETFNFRNRIIEIENKALRKLKAGEYVPPKNDGSQCYLCSRFESDVECLTNFGRYNICGYCIRLVKEIIDEKK